MWQSEHRKRDTGREITTNWNARGVRYSLQVLQDDAWVEICKIFVEINIDGCRTRRF